MGVRGRVLVNSRVRNAGIHTGTTTRASDHQLADAQCQPRCTTLPLVAPRTCRVLTKTMPEKRSWLRYFCGAAAGAAA